MTVDCKADVAVIIVNYNTADLALEAIESVLAQHHGGRSIEVHLVDNASPQGDAAVLAAEISARGWERQVTFYPETENHGFGRGNNLVLSALAERPARQRYVFLLNPDARLGNEAIGILADFLDARQEAAVAGARIEKPGGVTVTAAFRFPGVISTFSSALSFGPIARLLSRWQVPLAPEIPTGPVDWVSGAAVMLRMSALERAGFFDPSFFLYFEETDLMYRIKQQGGQVWHVAEANVIHDGGASTDVRSERRGRRRLPACWYHSWQHYFTKNYGRPNAFGAAAAWVIGALLNRVLSSLRGREPSYPLLFFEDFWAVAGRPLFGLKAIPYD
jgi:N-acetylglucosaminyl-diphospho-decaprenol L-rhamnosyltransferase